MQAYLAAIEQVAAYSGSFVGYENLSSAGFCLASSFCSLLLLLDEVLMLAIRLKGDVNGCTIFLLLLCHKCSWGQEDMCMLVR